MKLDLTKKELLELCQEKIGDEYFGLLQIASVIQICNDELANERVNAKVDKLIEFIRKEADRILNET